MRLRELKRAVCLILAFLMLSGSAGPVPSTAWAAAFEELQEVSSQSDESSSEQKEEKEEKNASSDEQKGGDSGSSDQKGENKGSDPESKEGAEGTKGTDSETKEGTEGTKGADSETKEGAEETKGTDSETKEDTEETKGTDSETKEGTEETKGTDSETKEGTEGTKGTDSETKEDTEGTDPESKEGTEETEAATRGLEGATRGAEGGTVSTGYMTLQGEIEFRDTEFWTILRPKSYEQPLNIVPIYLDEYDGEKDAPSEAWFTTQFNNSNQPCFFRLYPQGTNIIEFEINNVPKTVTVNGETKSVKGYRVRLPDPDPDSEQPSCYIQNHYVQTQIYLHEAVTKERVDENTVLMTGLKVVLYPIVCKSLALRSNVVPEDGASYSFAWEVTFTRPDSFHVDTMEKTITLEMSNWEFEGASSIFPTGLKYTAKPIEDTEYQRNYRLDPDESTQETWSGTIPGPDGDLVISSVNHPINLRLPFLVNWIDNNNTVGRPQDLSTIFKVQVRRSDQDENGNVFQWKDFPTDTTELENTYGITSAPTLERTGTGNNYAFTGLPGADKEAHALEYQVVIDHDKLAEKHYAALSSTSMAPLESFSEKNTTVVLSQSRSFQASIEWKDDSDKEAIRPAGASTDSTVTPYNLPNLRLYCRKSDLHGGKVLEEITEKYRGAWQWTQSGETGHWEQSGNTWNWEPSGDTWNLTVTDLPTYTEDNEEIEYFLVHGTDVVDAVGTETVSSVDITPASRRIYTPYYHNTTGSYASDETRCHAGGTITMLLSSTETFSTNIVWKDDGTADTIKNRPETTVTLWRYANEEGLDEAFQNEHASMVVYLEKGQEQPLSFTLPAGSKDATLTAILATDENSESEIKITYKYLDQNGAEQEGNKIINNVTLPGHDGHGKKYTYFLRETLTGDHKNDYRVSYTDSTKSYAEGAPEGGTVTNIRQEKALVTVVKTWRNPQGLEQIDGAKVQLALYASQGDSDPKPLQVYKPDVGSYDIYDSQTQSAQIQEQQTLMGFTTTIPTAQKSYYVNLYDDDGLPYDMENAKLVETVTLKGPGETTGTYTQALNGESISLGSAEYTVKTTYVEARSDLNNTPKRYHYDQLNTISSTRSYDLIKEWSLSDEKSKPYKANIAAVEMQLKRCLLKELNGSNTPWDENFTRTEYIQRPSGDNAAPENLVSTWNETVSGLPAFDENGNIYYYHATETGFILKDANGKKPVGATTEERTIGTETKTFVPFSAYQHNSEVKWGNFHTRSEQSTKVSNYDAPGTGHFVISKNWQDNNDQGRPSSVTVRIYNREQLYNLVKDKSENDFVKWDEINDSNDGACLSGDIKLNAPSYTYEQNYADLYASDHPLTEDEQNITHYVVLEYKVGDGEQTPASYTYGQIKALAYIPDTTNSGGTAPSITASDTATGKVDYNAVNDADDRSYNVTITRDTSYSTYYILDERTGTTKLHLTKIWNDEQNRDGLRPLQLSFQIYRDGELCKDLEGVTFLSGTEYVTAQAEKNGAYTGTFTATCANTDPNRASEWNITVDNLPMFDGETGMLYAYNIDETNASANYSSSDNTGPIHYIQSRGAVNSSVSGNTQQFDIPLYNTVAGTRTHTAYKYWKDISVNQKELRPELILTLYRYVGSEAEKLGIPATATYDDLVKLTSTQQESIHFEKVPSYNDPVMTPNGKKGTTETGASGQPYDWKITIDDLQRFDSSGKEYVYVLREQMTKDGATVLGQYKGNTVRTGEYDEFTNTITADLTLSGVKTWRGHESYTLTMSDLPEPTITLYRTTDDTLSGLSDLSDKSPAEIKTYLAQGKIVKVDEIDLTGTNKSRYSFPSAAKIQEYAHGDAGAGVGYDTGDAHQLDSSGSGTASAGEAAEPLFVYDGSQLKLPKYDANGKRYVYLMRETLPNQIVETLYSKTSASGTLVNTLNPDINRRQITVHKVWDRSKDTDNFTEYHSVTFELYRYLQKDGAAHATQLRPNKTILPKDLMKANNGECSVTFDDLLVRSPTGEPYGYYVVEKPIDGYKTVYSKTPFEDANDVGTENPQQLAFTDTDGWNRGIIEDDLYAKNTYEPSEQKIQLHGNKVWDDWHDEAGIRPPSIEVTLKRTTKEETLEGTGQQNHIKDHEVTLMEWNGTGEEPPVPWIKWVRDDSSTDSYGRDVWTYDVGGLIKFAPNGMLYIYTLSENRKYDGYGTPGSVSTSGKNPDASGAISLNPLTNTLTANYKFRKYWQDGSNLYHLRPQSITVVLQYSTDGGTTWQDMKFDEEKFALRFADSDPHHGASSRGNATDAGWFSYNSTGHSDALAVVLTAKDAVPYTNEGTWDYTFKNLPAKRKVGDVVKNVKYRCIEVRIGAAEVNYASSRLEQTTSKSLVDSDGFAVGAYQANYRQITDTGTVVENTLESTSLKVTKVWDDKDNLYQTRPRELLFQLERRGQTATGALADWTNVPVAGRQDGYFALTADHQTDPNNPNTWELTLKDLPVSGTENGTHFFTMEYRAVEVHDLDAQDADAGVHGAKNYADQMDYDDENKDGHSFDSNSAKNASTITNQLTTLATPIKAEKVWYASDNQDDANVEAKFELQYRVQGTEDWHSYDSPLTQTLSKKANGESQTVEWTDLPKYDRDGNELEYRIIESVVPNGYVCNPQADAGAGEGTSSGDGNNLDGNESGSGTGSTDGTGTYQFANIELQNYTVSKTWEKPGVDAANQAYVPDNSGSFTSTFILEQKIGDNAWAPVSGAPEKTLTGSNVEDSWDNLPKFTHDGKQIIYRAVETKINGNNVIGDSSANDVNEYTDGNYIVTYNYNGASANPAFDGTRTNSTNRLVYGFVNLSKVAAYLDPNGTPIVQDTNVDLSGVEFKILDANGNDYATGIFTDATGNLSHTNGKYGTEQRYLVSGTYTLVEVDTHNSALSRWNSGVQFTVGTNGGTTDTGEHGTAWISTNTTGNQLSLTVNYVASTAASHSFGDSCEPDTDLSDAFNLESRGVIEFTKKGPNGALLDTHSGSSGESHAYFGVYTDANCTDANQVAGMKADPADTTSTKGTKFVLTNEKQDGSTLSATKGSIPYLQPYDTTGFTLLSGTYYVKELVAPAGYKLDDTVREVTIAKLDKTAMGSDLSSVYSNNKGTFADGSTQSYEWSNSPNSVTIYKMDQFGRNVTLKDLEGGGKGYLELKFDESGALFPTGEETIYLYQDKDKPATKIDGTTQVGNESGKWSITYETKEIDGKERGYWTITGLFDANKSYTLSEPDGAVPDDNIKAKPIQFQILGTGEVFVDSSSDTHTKSRPVATAASGSEDAGDYMNAYDSNHNVVLRDVARFRKNVQLKKVKEGTDTFIQHISFNLYHVPKNGGAPELVSDPPLTTNNLGVINLAALDDTVINHVTGAPLKQGLDLGEYFFREVEKGASDGYRLAGDIHFTIKAVTPENTETAKYEDYAELEFKPLSTKGNAVTQSGDLGEVTNTPVSGKSLVLTKQDEDDNSNLSGARFQLEYVSINDGQGGAKQHTFLTYTTNDSGQLVDSLGNPPDISAKGTYTLTEIQAPALHSTYTTAEGSGSGAGSSGAGGATGGGSGSDTTAAGAAEGTLAGNGNNLGGTDSGTGSGTSSGSSSGSTTVSIPAMLQFTVNSHNEIVNVSGTSSYLLDAFLGSGLVGTPTVSTGDQGDLDVTVKNNKTVVTIDKRNDLHNSFKTRNQQNLNGELLTGAVLKIYEGTSTSGTPISTLYGDGTASTTTPGTVTDNGGSSWTLTGALSENIVYTLHEESAPEGYLTAKDLYFCLFGTRSTGSGTESQLYVWTDSNTTPTAAVNALSTPDSCWSKVQNLNDNDLTMVDEVVIAPVDARKVLDTGGSALQGAEFDVSVTGGAKLGTVVSDANGYLKWQSLTNEALNGLVYNSQGKRITAPTDAEGGSVILRKNNAGYTFHETSAPDNAYNEGFDPNKVYRVKITDQNYREYKTNPNNAIDLVEAEGNTTDHTVANLKARASLTALVNPAYHSTVTLHKYDSDPEANAAAIEGATFTLYRNGDSSPYEKASVTGESVQTNGEFTTNANGDLSITIPEKGSYTLTETAAAAGYKLDTSNTISFTLVDKSEDGKFDYDHITPLKKDGTDTNGFPNERQYGTITLTKTDFNKSNVKLGGVEYTLTKEGEASYFGASPQTVTTGYTYTATYSDNPRTCTLTQGTTNSDGQLIITNLDWGTYTLTEKTELSGYKLDSHTKTFTIGSSTLNLSDTATNTKNQVTFRKTDNSSPAVNLSGAKFKVYKLNGTTKEYVSFYLSADAASTTNEVTVTAANGEVTIYGLPTDTSSANAATTYYLEEVKAPDGYVRNPNPVAFTIDRAGNVQVNNAKVNEVKMVDKPIKVTLDKLNEDGSTHLNGAVFTLTPQDESRFVAASTSIPMTLSQTGANGTVEIPTGTLIGGHSYILEETKAPDGYEATAKIYFTVNENGSVTIDPNNTKGGYVASGQTTCCTADNVDTSSNLEYESTTLSIRDEKISVKLTKVDSNNAGTKLDHATFTLKPYSTTLETPTNEDHFPTGFTATGLNVTNNVYSATTDNKGEINIPDGLLVHGCKYLLKETAINPSNPSPGYYLGKEARDGVILDVKLDGTIEVKRLPAYDGKKVNGESSCPVTADNTAGTVALTAKNPKAAAFQFTKDVSGNMGDLSGSFEITMEVYEPDGTLITTKQVTLEKGQQYSSESGKLAANGQVTDAGTSAIGLNAIPVGATLKIIENSDQDYEALVIQDVTGATKLPEDEKGEVWLRLDQDVGTGTIQFTLTNNKDVPIDVGVVLEENTPYALIALLIPAVWLYLRSRRRRRDGDDE